LISLPRLLGTHFHERRSSEADLYGLNASRQPDGEAEVDLLLGEYRSSVHLFRVELKHALPGAAQSGQ
jgi:hypothetical protein